MRIPYDSTFCSIRKGKGAGLETKLANCPVCGTGSVFVYNGQNYVCVKCNSPEDSEKQIKCNSAYTKTG